MTRNLPRLAALLAALTLAGCLEREEHIVVAPDGALEVTHTFKGDAAEFGPTGDALPTGAPWVVTDRDVPREDGKGDDHVREAKGRFAGAAALPEGFGLPGDETSLRFSTHLAIERLSDGSTRYTFERRHAPRALAWRERLLERHLPTDVRERLGGKREGALGEADKRAALAGLLAFERAKGQALLAAALAEVTPSSDGDPAAARRTLRATTAYAAAFDAAWRVDDVLAFIAAPRAEQVALEARYRDETLRAAVAAGVAAATAEGAAPGAALEQALRAALEAERRRLEASEDLQDEQFVVRVTFPGQVELSDAHALEDGGRTAVFRFSGKDLADQTHVLRAVAVSRP